jgi:hypothetical protein
VEVDYNFISLFNKNNINLTSTQRKGIKNDRTLYHFFAIPSCFEANLIFG